MIEVAPSKPKLAATKKRHKSDDADGLGPAMKLGKTTSTCSSGRTVNQDAPKKSAKLASSFEDVGEQGSGKKSVKLSNGLSKPKSSISELALGDTALVTGRRADVAEGAENIPLGDEKAEIIPLGDERAEDIPLGDEKAEVSEKQNTVKPEKEVADKVAGADKNAHDISGGDNASAAVEGEVSKKKTSVKLKKKVVERIRSLNADGKLVAPLRLGAVAALLAQLGEENALCVLDTLTIPAADGGGEGVEDPTAWIVAAAEGAAEQAGWEEERWSAWEEKETRRAGDLLENLSATVIERIRMLNRTITFEEPLRLTKIAGPLTVAGEAAALKVLDDLEAKASELEDLPSFWVLKAALKTAGPVMRQVDQLNRGGVGKMDLQERLVADKVRGPLNLLSKGEALQVLKELEEKSHEIEDPTAWVIGASEARVKILDHPLAKRLQKLNDSGTLQEAVNIPDAVEALSKIHERLAASVVGQLEKRGDIRKPMGWIHAGVTRITEEANKRKEEANKRKEEANKRKVDLAHDVEMAKASRKGVSGKGKAAAGKGKSKMTAGESRDLGPMANTAPSTPPLEENNEEEEEEDLPPLDPIAAAQAEAAAWRELQEAFGEGAPEDDWPSEDEQAAAPAATMPKKPCGGSLNEAEEVGAACDDGEPDGEYEFGEGDDDDMQ